MVIIIVLDRERQAVETFDKVYWISNTLSSKQRTCGMICTSWQEYLNVNTYTIYSDWYFSPEINVEAAAFQLVSANKNIHLVTTTYIDD